MKNRREFRPSTVDALEERLVLSHVFLGQFGAAPALTGGNFSRGEVTNARTLNRVVGELNRALNNFGNDYMRRYQAAVHAEQVTRDPNAAAQLDRVTSSRLNGPNGFGGLQAQVRNIVSRLPYGSRELYQNGLQGGMADFVAFDLNLGGGGTTYGTTAQGQMDKLNFARNTLINTVQNYFNNQGLPGRGADAGTPLFLIR